MLLYTQGSSSPRSLSSDTILDLAPGETLSIDLSSGGHWFGHGFNHVQPYPLETGSVSNPAFAVNNIQSPIWMCSAGAAVLAETTRRLDVRLNENGNGKLRITSPDEPLRVRFWRRPTLPEAQGELLRHLAWPGPTPAAELFGDSFFCTWTQYPRTITQERIMDMAREIRARDYPCSTLIIDDRWESCFGELTFAREFPDPVAMIRELHALGFRVWLWVTPFVNREAGCFEKLSRDKVLVPRRDGEGAALFTWWGGTAGLLDVTSPQGRQWLRERLQELRTRYGVDGFKIDGGDAKYQPAPAIAAWHDYAGESGYSDAQLSLFEDIVPGACESRTAWLSQRRAILWREGGKDSHWGLDNGLAAMVTLALHLGLMGYDFLIPDMVPGRVQTLMADHPLPTDELMVRWTEATAFMPFMQFSYFPWNYAAETEQILRAYARLHKRLQPYLVEQSRDRRAPLLRPVWYDAPHVEALFTVADEYLLGHDLLVAPVVKSGGVSRDVVLPPGRWTDAWTGRPVAEGFHTEYPSPCPGIPLFVRSERGDLLALLEEALAAIAGQRLPSAVTTTTYSAGLNRDITVTG